MRVCVTTPMKDHHRAWLLAAAGGRCELVAGIDETAQAVIGDLKPKELKNMKNLRWFHLVWAGVDRYKKSDLPLDAVMTNGSGAYGATMAEHMIACILVLYRQLRHYGRLQAQHQWDSNWKEEILEGKKVLILGTGDIGTALAKRLKAFECEVIGIRRIKKPAQDFDEVYAIEDLEELLPQADIVACCLPGTDQTKKLLNEERLRSMKPTALLLNCGRGSLIDTKALETVLMEGHLGGCGLDVTDPEPLPQDSPLWAMENVIITPHISGASFGHVDAIEDKIYRLAAENLRRYLDGEELLNQVDFKKGYRT